MRHLVFGYGFPLVVIFHYNIIPYLWHLNGKKPTCFVFVGFAIFNGVDDQLNVTIYCIFQK